MSEQKNEKQGNVKNTKKKRKESLILKYGSIAFFEILTIISLFLWFTTRNIKLLLNTFMMNPSIIFWMQL